MDPCADAGQPPAAIIVGVLVRVEPGREGPLLARLERLPGACTVWEQGPGQLGLVLAAATADQAAELIQQQVASCPGVLACWPVFQCDESQLPEFLDV